MFQYYVRFLSSAVQNFSFVLTNLEGKFTYGFCRQAPHSETALVLLSSLPWHETFYRLLNHAAELTHSSDAGELNRFLEASYKSRVPDPGSVFHVSWGNEGEGGKDFTAQCPHMDGLPTIPENVSLKNVN